jgi:hypothetical protein
MTWLLIVLVVVVVVLAAVVAWALVGKRRTQRLRSQFGPEYDRAMTEADNRRSAESELEARRRRREDLDIRPLSPEARERYARSWRDAQARFVDAPAEAIRQADALTMEVMRERGYPVDDFDQRSADISVDHPDVVENYRAAHGISMASEHGKASTEDLRQGMVHYRALFEELLEGTGQTREAQ